jgi:tetratricopeptide (TPR) repeat protein
MLAALATAACSGGPGGAAREGDGTPPPAAAVEQFEQAVAALDAGELDVATRDFADLGAAYPEYSTPLVNLGIAHARAGRLAEAQQALEEAVARDPGQAVAWNELGIVLRRQGRFEQARAAYEAATRADDTYAIAYLNLGVLCDLYLDLPQDALQAYDSYVTLAGTPDPRVDGWITELKTRLGHDERTARSGP